MVIELAAFYTTAGEGRKTLVRSYDNTTGIITLSVNGGGNTLCYKNNRPMINIGIITNKVSLITLENVSTTSNKFTVSGLPENIDVNRCTVDYSHWYFLNESYHWLEKTINGDTLSVTGNALFYKNPVIDTVRVLYC